MRTLLIDNYDSFTYNLFQLLAVATGHDPVVVRNDEASWAELARLGFDNVVVSPGPGRPDTPRDFGICADAIREARVPLLGVCLGHQGIGHIAGARVVRAPEPMHGRLSGVRHDGSELFAGMPQGFRVVRYHSLCLTEPVPPNLRSIAWTEDGVVMAVAHRHRPLWGVQFHPESICTEWGRRLLVNFRDLSADRIHETRATARGLPTTVDRWSPPQRPRLRLLVRRVDRLFDAETIFDRLYGEDDFAFWLDSSNATGDARFSFMGASGGPLSSVVTYDVGARRVDVVRGLARECYQESIFDYLDRETSRLRYRSDELPFDFNCGFVGYMGYELKADCQGDLAHESPLPDAAFILADRVVAFDHLEQCSYLLCLTEPSCELDGRRWLDETSRELESLPPLKAGTQDANTRSVAEPYLSRSRDRYLADIEEVKRLLREGESYEVCLTNRVLVDHSPEPFPLYRTLRRLNPAPFSAYLRFGAVSVLSSSPERFLRIGRDGWVEAKPIKGTAPRGANDHEDERLATELQTDEKSRAENLMITDLLRNDLGIVCDVGTVHVPHLMAIESYETVHQLVSTVRGRLREGVSVPACIRACFPGGSMTGAPKKRTMEIIDRVERDARGVYAGAIGYLGLGGASDLSIVIRTIVLDGSTATVGTGGAIVMQSDPEDEYQESLLKARVIIDALAAHGAGGAELRTRERAERLSSLIP